MADQIRRTGITYEDAMGAARRGGSIDFEGRKARVVHLSQRSGTDTPHSARIELDLGEGCHKKLTPKEAPPTTSMVRTEAFTGRSSVSPASSASTGGGFGTPPEEPKLLHPHDLRPPPQRQRAPLRRWSLARGARSRGKKAQSLPKGGEHPDACLASFPGPEPVPLLECPAHSCAGPFPHVTSASYSQTEPDAKS
jgi:hypothetical protein